MTLNCRVCGGRALEAAGTVAGKFAGRTFELAHCRTCRFSFVTEPWTDYAAIYSEAYYQGHGADPYVDYMFELEHPDRTVRQYEWDGLMRVAATLIQRQAGVRWLDFGCGNGGLIRWAREHGDVSVAGYETGWIADRVRQMGLPLISDAELEASSGVFDLVTAIEVLEHIVDPVAALRTIRRLLKPGGVLFVTTGNAKPFRGRLPGWRYVTPEIHVSFFEPETLAFAYARAGLSAAFHGFLPGFDQIIRFKVLKALRVRERGLVERLVPWGIVARAVDARLGVTAHPTAQRTGDLP